MKIRGLGRWVEDALGSFAKISGLAVAFLVLALSGGVAAASGEPDFGPNVFIFSPDMPQSEIQAIINTVANQQVSNQFGTQRYALLFKPGTYGLKKDPQTGKPNPLTVPVGYYTMVAGLGQSPNDVVINGAVNAYDQCFPPSNNNNCTALVNFWRSLSNLSINLTSSGGCNGAAEFWAVSQAAPIRRAHVVGLTTLFDFCDNPHFASGGFIADSQFDSSTIINGSQQQFIVRNSKIDGWTNGVWNQVFSGVIGAPAQCFPCGNRYTTLATSPVTREAPYLYIDVNGNYNVFVPAVNQNSSGTTWGSGPTPGSSVPIEKFFIASPSNSAADMTAAMASGKNLILTPGVYQLDQTIEITHPDTVVLGLGFPTLVPQNGVVAMRSVAGSQGVLISGVIFEAGPATSPALLQIGTGKANDHNDASDPAVLSDVFFRIGGAAAGSATNSLVVNSDNVILDDIWAWRADHGNPGTVGWTINTADTGVVVNGDNVTAYGLFVEHYQKYEVIWNGNGGTDVFFQNEMPYDPPSQDAWMEAPGVDGYAAFKVADNVTSFSGYGMGSYSFFNHIFNQDMDIFAANAFEVPTTLSPGSMHDLLTIFLSTSGKGGIQHVINGTGGSSTIANPDTPVTVVSYP
jgi:hypothetical protein